MIRLLAALLALALVAGCASNPPSTPSDRASLAPASRAPSASRSPSAPRAPSAAPTAGVGAIGVASLSARRLPTAPADAGLAGRAVNAFGLDLYARLVAADPQASLVVSPASIASALAMARAGAKGMTATEMDAVMRDLGTDDNETWVAALDLSLNGKTATYQDATGQSQDVTLRSVNAPFAQDGYPLERAYLEALAQRFGAGLQLVDFSGHPEESRGAINGWVGDKTESRIPELLGPGSVDATTRLVLVNAMYLKAAWQLAFQEGATTKAPFTLLDGTTTDVAMMRLAASLPYAAGTGWRAVDLGYVGGALSMLVIVPDDLAAFEAGLDPAALDAIMGALAGTEVRLALPKLRTESQVALADVLKAMGMPTAFDPDAADFSAMTARERLFIGAVAHHANIDVDEKGTEAAAATAVVMTAAGAPGKPVSLTVDRPFIFALRDLETGTVLFLGRITKPEVRS